MKCFSGFTKIVEFRAKASFGADKLVSSKLLIIKWTPPTTTVRVNGKYLMIVPCM